MTSEAELKDLLRKILQENSGIQGTVRFPEHKMAVASWILSMRQGTLNGRPFSEHTVNSYAFYVRNFLEKYQQISFEALEAELLEISIIQFGRRDKLFRGVYCFGKYLVRENSLSESFLSKAKGIKPKRHIPAKQSSITELEIQKLLKACQNQYEQLMIQLLSTTGLRASEFCALKLQDINFKERFLIVQNGKWGKRRRVGLHKQVYELLQQHIKQYHITQPSEFLFLNADFQPLDSSGLLSRLRRIGKRAGVSISTHAFRRAFVTINANKGHSLVMLQIACGHADIKTTRSYCQTSENEVIEAMKDWEYDYLNS